MYNLWRRHCGARMGVRPQIRLAVLAVDGAPTYFALKETPMDELAAYAIRAHGGMQRWRQFSRISARQLVSGVFCETKAKQDLVNNVQITVALHRQWASMVPFGGPALRSSLEPRRVAIEALGGQVMAERFQPRLSFQRHAAVGSWDTLQLAYFMGYAMWTYLTTPFVFAMDGVHSEEMAPWDEYGECWRRLKVRFPATIATHCDEQIFYFNEAGLLQRHDYDIDIAGKTPMADYVAEHQEFSGIIVPTNRLLLARLTDNTAQPEPAIASIMLDQIDFV